MPSLAHPQAAERMFRAEGISKSYGQNRVLDGVGLEIASGESIALLGENGAGKSTFAKIIAGVLPPSAGSLELEGRRLNLGSPAKAIEAGIGFIPQELTYVPELTAAENIAMGEWPSRRGVFSPAAMVAQSERSLRRFGFEVDLGLPMERLSVAERQLVEITKALQKNVRLLVLDEPTAALGERESTLLFEALRRLCAKGVALVSVLHRLDQARQVADRAMVLRNGRLVLTVDRKSFDEHRVVSAMLGERAERIEETVGRKGPARTGRAVLSIRDVRTGGAVSLRGFGLSLSAGEIVGVFGAKGCGGELLGPILSGVARPSGGAIEVDGAPVALTGPAQSRRIGISCVPRERKREGLILSRSVLENICLTRPEGFARWGLVRRRAAAETASRMVQALDIRCASLNQAVGELSGGNQQKVLLASRILDDPRILVLDHPTRGVDVGARSQIHAFLKDLTERGMALLLISTDVEETTLLSDRVVVLRDGRIVGELSGEDVREDTALKAATAG